jgi:hypothetical protein
LDGSPPLGVVPAALEADAGALAVTRDDVVVADVLRLDVAVLRHGLNRCVQPLRRRNGVRQVESVAEVARQGGDVRPGHPDRADPTETVRQRPKLHRRGLVEHFKDEQHATTVGGAIIRLVSAA